MAKTRSTEKAARKSRGRPFPKGNPGKPKGARNKTIVALEALLEGEAEAIIRKVAELARQGDPMAMRLCFERILGARRDRPIALPLPPIKTAADRAVAMAALLESIAKGEVTPAEAVQVAQLIEKTGEMVSAATLSERVRKLERGEVDGSVSPELPEKPFEPYSERVDIPLPPTSKERSDNGGGK